MCVRCARLGQKKNNQIKMTAQPNPFEVSEQQTNACRILKCKKGQDKYEMQKKMKEISYTRAKCHEMRITKIGDENK